MRLVYSGPHPEVVVDELDSEQVIVRGEAVNVPDELGARLLEQDTWQDAADDTSNAARNVPVARKQPDPASPPADDNASKGDN